MSERGELTGGRRVTPAAPASPGEEAVSDDAEAAPAPGPDLRLLPPALGAWAAAWWATASTAGAVFAAAALLAGPVLAGVFLVVARRRRGRVRRGAAVLLVAATACAVLAATGTRLAERESGPLPGWAAERATVTVAGRVSGDPRRLEAGFPGAPPRWAVRVRPHLVTARGTTVPGTGALLVLGGGSWAASVAGSTVRFTGRLLPPRRGDPTVAAVVAPRGPVVLDPGTLPWRVAERLRAGLRTACDPLGADARGLLPALVVGDTSRLPPELRTDLVASGLTHLTAVSGANVAVIAGAVLAAAVLAGAGRRVRTVVTGAAVLGFVVLARPEPSVLRAAVMGSVALVGVLLSRRGRGVPALAAAAVGLLVADPWLARSFGFVLSALATAGLLLLVPALVARVPGPRPLALALAVPVAAQAVTAPVVVLLEPAVSLVAVPANLLAAPAVAPATVLGVAAAAASPLWPAGAGWLAAAGGVATGWIAAIAHRAADVPGGSVPWPAGLPGAVLLAVLTAVTSAAVLRRTGRRAVSPGADATWRALALTAWSGRTAQKTVPGVRAGLPPGAGGRAPSLRLRTGRPPERAPGAGLLAAGTAVVLVAAGAGWAVRPGAGGPVRDWAVVQCDVGQGDALLLRSGEHRAVLVDAGPDPEAVDRCLDRWQVHRLDLVVITHYHADHAAGLGGALRSRGSPPVLVSPLAAPRERVRQVARDAAAAGVQVQVGAAGFGGQVGEPGRVVRWRLLWPSAGSRPPVPDGSDAPEGAVVNDASLVLLAEVGGVRVLSLGDVETDAQVALVPRLAPFAPVDVVKVAHHGSARQHPPLYAALRPRVALIGVGAGNDYGHPAPSALSMLRAVGAPVLRTDRDGDLAVSGTQQRLVAVAAG